MKMTYSHKTNHSFTPPIEFWRPIENLIISFPFWSGGNRWKSHYGLIKFYEMQTQESFDINDNDRDVHGNLLQEGFISKGLRDIAIKNIPFPKRQLIPPDKIMYHTNELGKIVKFLSSHISKPDTVYKFQHFFECMYMYLKDVHNFNPNNDVIRSHGLGNKEDANYKTKKEKFIKNYIESETGLIKLKDFKDYFNSVCRKYDVPFVMYEQKEECYVVHTTDIFIEKIIQNIPLFLKHPNLNQANDYFIKAYNERDKSNYSECLNNIRKGMEEIRDFIYNQYPLSNKTGNLSTDLKMLFNIHSNIVFDYTKIPETDSNRINKVVNYLEGSVLLCVKITNIGSHSSSVPNLIEENTTLFALGLVASIFPYFFYLLK